MNLQYGQERMDNNIYWVPNTYQECGLGPFLFFQIYTGILHDDYTLSHLQPTKRNLRRSFTEISVGQLGYDKHSLEQLEYNE